jgi:hypothetical protein
MMNTPDHHDDPLISRRRWLQGALAVVVASLTGSATLQVFAASPTTDGLSRFMTLSQHLTTPHILNPEIGQRLYNALTATTPDFSAQLAPLMQALVAGNLSPAQNALALSILQAWYLGTVNNQVISYEHALIFAATQDVHIIRSYCDQQPGYWASKPGEA